MKKYLALIASILSSLICLSCARSTNYQKEQGYYRPEPELATRAGSTTRRAERFAPPKKKIFVLPFYNATPLGGDYFGVFAASELLRSIRTSTSVVAPEDLKSQAISKDFYSADKVRLSLLIREGKNIGVSLLLIGKIKKIVYRQKGSSVGIFGGKKSLAAVDMEIRLYDISAGKESLFAERSCDSSNSQVKLFGGDSPSGSDTKSQREELVHQAIRSCTSQFTDQIDRAVDKINWEGRIARITAGKLYVNAGRASGLNIGDILKVMTIGEDIYDPETAAYMGRTAGQTKGTLEVVDFFGPDSAVCTVHSGGGFVENDAVQLY